MSKEVTMFNFDGSDVRVIADAKGEPWFLAKDIAAILEYRDAPTMTRNLDDDEKLLHTMCVAGQNREVSIINESGLYSSIMGSRKPEAKKFKKWVTSEVLPSIRKTGGYQAPPKTESEQQKPVSLVPAQREFKAALSLAKMFGFEGNQALLSANMAVKKTLDIDVIQYLGAQIISDKQGRFYNPTDIGHMAGNLSGMVTNKRLEEQGFQTKNERGDWVPTEKGKPFSMFIDTTKRHHNGTPIKQLVWLETIVEHIQVTPMGLVVMPSKQAATAEAKA